MKIRLLCATSVAAFGLAVGAAAQTTPTAGTGRADIDVAARTAPAIASAPSPLPAAYRAPCPFVGQGEVTLTSVRAQGARSVRQDAIDAATADLLNRPLDLGVICEARDRVAALYIRDGRPLTRVELPEQRISGGALTLQVTEGYFAGATIENGAAHGPSAALAQAYLDSLQTGSPAEWREIERALLLVREIPGADVQLALRPSSAGEGALEAVARFAPRRRLDLTLGAQQQGSEELGRTAVSARIDANSFTRWGERTTLVASVSTTGAQQVVQLIEEVRLGSSGLLLTGDLAYSRSRPEGALEPLDLDGEAWIGRIGLAYPVLKSRSASVTIAGRFESVDQENDLGLFGTPISLFEDQLRVVSAEGSWLWRPQTAPGFATAGTVEVRRGLDALGASDAGDALLSRAEGRPDFTSVRVRGRVRQALQPETGLGPWVSAAVEAQWADGPLLAYEEQQLGNYTIGRGFDPGSASGDRGAGLQLEAGWTVVRGGAMFEPFIFIDAVDLRNEDAGGLDSSAWSVGAGVRGRAAGVDFSLTYAAPQSEPIAGATTPDDRVLFTVSRTLSFR